MGNNFCYCGYHTYKPCAMKVPIFAGLDKDELQKMVSLITQKRYSKGESICSEGSIMESLIIINRGKVKIYKNTQDGKEQILYILSEGDFFGERNILHQKESDINAEAMEDTLICMISRHDCQELMMKQPNICLKIIDELCSRLDRMESHFNNISPKDTDNRVKSMLMEFAGKYGTRCPKGIIIELPLKREEMAGYIGITRETLSRKLAMLDDQGIIELKGSKKIIILDEQALKC